MARARAGAWAGARVRARTGKSSSLDFVVPPEQQRARLGGCVPKDGDALSLGGRALGDGGVDEREEPAHEKGDPLRLEGERLRHVRGQVLLERAPALRVVPQQA